MPDTFLFPRDTKVSRSNLLLDVTIRDFSGGWNVVDNDLNLDTKYSKVLENMQRGVDGSNSVRPGTRLFADASEYLDIIINCEYFSNHIVAVGANGKVVKIDASGNVNEIWSDEWANNLAGSPDGWSTTSFVSFAIFNGDLIICNGINKPLIVNSDMMCSYLKDLADDSNANTPIARFVTAHGRYLVMAGSLTAGLEDRLFISNTDTSGTWLGDSAPNDSITVDLGSRVPHGSSTITGLGRFRDKLMVFFENAVLPGTLGVFESSVHTPTFTDAIENFGALSHRVVQTVGEDILFADNAGVSTIKRALFTGAITTERVSSLIDPAYINAVDGLTTVAALEDRTWSLWDSDSKNYMLFIPDADAIGNTTETRCFVFKKNSELKIEAWHDWRNWNFRSGCRSSLKRIFLTEGTQVFVLGEEHLDPVYRDYELDQEMWDDDMPFTDYTGWTPYSDATDSGIPIKFAWELPWSDNNERFLTKASRYINLDTNGDDHFTLQMFTDNIYYDRTDLGENWEEDELKFDDEFGWDVSVLDPALELEFHSGDSPGFGLDEFGQSYGGGRATRLEKLIAWCARYKIQKLRISGDALGQLDFISITLAYQKGSPRR